MTKLQTLKRELEYSLFAYLIFKNQNEAQLKWGQTPNRSEEEKQLRRCKLLIVRIDLYYMHQNIENYKFLNN
jgi:hypothetical protein